MKTRRLAKLRSEWQVKIFVVKHLYNYLVLFASFPDSEIGGGHRLNFSNFRRIKRHGCFWNILQRVSKRNDSKRKTWPLPVEVSS